MSGPNQEQFVLDDPKAVTDCSDIKKASTVNTLTCILLFFFLTVLFWSLHALLQVMHRFNLQETWGQ